MDLSMENILCDDLHLNEMDEMKNVFLIDV
jgi:hypothetical protein